MYAYVSIDITELNALEAYNQSSKYCGILMMYLFLVDILGGQDSMRAKVFRNHVKIHHTLVLR
jgi:hypothetical protein